MEVDTDGIPAMGDDELRLAWDGEGEPSLIRKLEHEMAMRFMFRRKGGQREYFLDKFLRMPEQFKEAFRAGDWPRAKYIYDSAIVVGRFIEAPEAVRDRVFGSRQDERNPVEGLFPDWMVDRVMHECVVRNRLGHECMVYRVPGEIGFYGARQIPGARRMAAEENPAYRAVEAEGGGSREGG